MSEVSEAMDRAENRLAAMSEADRGKYGLLIMQQELRRLRAPLSPSLESPAALNPTPERTNDEQG